MRRTALCQRVNDGWTYIMNAVGRFHSSRAHPETAHRTDSKSHSSCAAPSSRGTDRDARTKIGVRRAAHSCKYPRLHASICIRIESAGGRDAPPSVSYNGLQRRRSSSRGDKDGARACGEEPSGDDKTTDKRLTIGLKNEALLSPKTGRPDPHNQRVARLTNGRQSAAARGVLGWFRAIA